MYQIAHKYYNNQSELNNRSPGPLAYDLSTSNGLFKRIKTGGMIGKGKRELTRESNP